MQYITFLSAYPAWIKVLLAVGVLCVFVSVLGMVFTPVPKSEAETSSSSGPVSITSNNQKGGITAGKVDVGKP